MGNRLSFIFEQSQPCTNLAKNFLYFCFPIISPKMTSRQPRSKLPRPKDAAVTINDVTRQPSVFGQSDIALKKMFANRVPVGTFPFFLESTRTTAACTDVLEQNLPGQRSLQKRTTVNRWKHITYYFGAVMTRYTWSKVERDFFSFIK